MRIAVISDIHGNMESLSALTEPYDELWVLGDLVNYGPDPGAVVDFVRSHATVVVRGNHDHAVGFNEDPRCSPPYREMAKETMQFTRSVLSRDQIDYLASLPLVAERMVEDTRFFLCHAAPSDPLYKYVPANSPLWEPEMELVSADFLLVGHTHTPFVQPAGVSLVVNPGSLGQPKTGSTKACYAIWERGAVLQSADYDIERTLGKIDRMPVSVGVRESLKAVLRTGGQLQTSKGTQRGKRSDRIAGW
jgi:putative phosphoesterase